MSVYGKSGGALSSVYAVDASAADRAFDVDGIEVFRRGLKVCTYNVGGWYIGSGTNVPSDQDSAFYELQNGIISEINADILLIEEFWTTFSQSGRTALSLLSPYYSYIHTEDGNQKYTGRAICSKFPISSYTRHTFSGETRYYDDAVISVLGKTIHFIVTHLHPSSQADRVAESTELCNYVKTLTGQFIIGGDFNNILQNPLSSSNEAIYRQFLDEGYTMANGGALGILDTACNSADWANDKFAIDNIIVSNGFAIDSIGTNTAKITSQAVLDIGKIDHIPFYATIVDA